jgi:predicted amidohydrolase
VLPELFNTGYAHPDRDAVAALAEENAGPTVEWAKSISRTCGAAVCGGFARREGDRVFNSSFLVDGDALLAVYDKVHLFHRERFLFDAGGGPFPVVPCRGVPVGIMICFDWIFPEVCRSLALDGARVVLHPSNLVMPWCQDAMRVRCLENGVFALTANRIGHEEHLVFTGGSQITGPKGEVLSRAPQVGEHAFVVEIDPGDAADKSVTEFSDRLADRRPDLYGRLCRPRD